MAPSVQFGMLQKLKTMDFQNNPQAKSIQQELKTQSDIFTEAKESYEKVAQNGDEGSQATTGAFAQTSMSVEELENKMNTEQEKLERLMQTLTQETEKKPDNSCANEDDKNKVKPKQFGSLMA